MPPDWGVGLDSGIGSVWTVYMAAEAGVLGVVHRSRRARDRSQDRVRLPSSAAAVVADIAVDYRAAADSCTVAFGIDIAAVVAVARSDPCRTVGVAVAEVAGVAAA